ncbi:lactate utilization protein C [Pueribacillus theae]|uniref:Lactate utilization protein C n=1 Tax=Pueribacillus theae TaxID=2171751 RepID=A0A2U1K6A2_9BACI|nr:lactate utilization protein C [Pueribacillus theae]PWA13071.1 lactate utilization protein C [Pueribacillus theae]
MQKGTIHNREAFLNRISSKLNRPQPNAVTRPAWSRSPQFEVLKDKTQDELVDVLVEQSKLIHTDVVKTTNAELAASLEKVILDQSAKRIITSNEPRYEEFNLRSLFDEKLPNGGCDVHIWNPEHDRENIAIAEKADIGITFSDITLAESGTVVLFSNKYKGRSVSLLPTAYIAIIPKSTIVPRMTQATAEIHKRVELGEITPSCINFISGPSNSADIEMNLVVGVHGPVRATYIVVLDK